MASERHGYQLPLELDRSSQFCIDYYTLLRPWNNSIQFGVFIPKSVEFSKRQPKHNKTSLNN